MHNEKQIPKIWETEEDKKLTIFNLKTKYKKILQSYFQGHRYFNRDKKIWISVSSDFVRQWVIKSRTRERIILIQVLNLLLENAIFDGYPIPDRKNRAEIEHYLHFYKIVIINGKEYNVILKVVKPVNQNHKLYYFSLESISK